MSGIPSGDRIENNTIELSEKELLGLHQTFIDLTSEDRACSIIGCDNEGLVDALLPIGITSTVCARCLPKHVFYYWDHLYDTDDETREAVLQICRSLDPELEYVRPSKEVTPITEDDVSAIRPLDQLLDKDHPERPDHL